MLPGLVLVVAAAAMAIVALTRVDPDRRAQLTRPATLAGAARRPVVVLVAIPIGVVEGRRLLTNLPIGGTAEASAGLLGALSSLGIVAAVSGVLVAQLKRRWLRLGGVLLAVVALLFAGKVADTFAYGYDGVWRREAFVVIAVLWLVALDLVASHRLTLGGLYRKRLTATFRSATARARRCHRCRTGPSRTGRATRVRADPSSSSP